MRVVAPEGPVRSQKPTTSQSSRRAVPDVSRPTGVPLDAQRLLQLQRLVGNRATTALLASAGGNGHPSSGGTIQRKKGKQKVGEESKGESHSLEEEGEGTDAGAGSSTDQVGAGDDEAFLEPGGNLTRTSKVLTPKGRRLWKLEHKEKDVKETVPGYQRAIRGYVMQAGKDYGVVQEQTELVETDFKGVSAAVEAYERLETAAEKVPWVDDRDKQLEKIRSQQRKIVKAFEKDLPDLPKAAGLGDKAAGMGTKAASRTFGWHRRAGSRDSHPAPPSERRGDVSAMLLGARQRAGRRSERAKAFMEDVTFQRALIEHDADEAQAERNEREEARLNQKFDRKSGRAKADPREDPATLNVSLAKFKRWAGDAKRRSAIVRDLRAEVNKDFVTVKETLDRFPGTTRKIYWGAVVGGASFVASMGSLGVLGVEKRTDDQGRVKTWPFKVSLLNNLTDRIKEYTKEASLRAGRFVWDKLSAVLGFFNEVVLQNYINITGTIGTWLSLVGGIAAFVGAVGYGAGAAVGALIAKVGLVLAASGLVAALVKGAINTLRAHAAFLTALWNQDAKLQNQLNARTTGTTIKLAGDVSQAVSKGIGVGGDVVGVGGWTNSLSSVADYGYKAGYYTADVSAMGGNLVAGSVFPAGFDALNDRQSAYDNTGPGGNRLQPALGQNGGLGNRMDPVSRAKTAAERKRFRVAVEIRTEAMKDKAKPVNTRVKEFGLRVRSVFAPLVRVVAALKKIAAWVVSAFTGNRKGAEKVQPDPVEGAQQGDATNDMVGQVTEAAGVTSNMLDQAEGPQGAPDPDKEAAADDGK
jgi:hypothetical protein